LNALACGATVLASRTAPVCEVIEHEKTGLLADFFDIEGLADQACRVLDDTAAFRTLGQTGLEQVREKYSLDVCLPQLVDLFEQTAARCPPRKSSTNRRLGTCAMLFRLYSQAVVRSDSPSPPDNPVLGSLRERRD